jgi:steroid delta-isomerase-like uncharacterized protein
MSEHSKSLLLRYAEEVWNQRNLEVIEEIFSPDHVYHDPILTQLARGPEGVRQKVEIFTAAFPDSHVISNDVVAEGDRVALLWTYSGTHTGEMMGIAPTGKRGEAQGVHFCRVRDGRIIESRNLWNGLSFLQQLGLVQVG